ncbi:hypothetical protein DINM_005513 [Dirofilaria immitis]|nr:hypothetical protein [Dirofilaria immitis]
MRIVRICRSLEDLKRENTKILTSRKSITMCFTEKMTTQFLIQEVRLVDAHRFSKRQAQLEGLTEEEINKGGSITMEIKTYRDQRADWKIRKDASKYPLIFQGIIQ